MLPTDARKGIISAMKTFQIIAAIAALCAVAICTGCMGEGENEFRPTPGIINVSY